MVRYHADDRARIPGALPRVDGAADRTPSVVVAPGKRFVDDRDAGLPVGQKLPAEHDRNSPGLEEPREDVLEVDSLRIDRVGDGNTHRAGFGVVEQGPD